MTAGMTAAPVGTRSQLQRLRADPQSYRIVLDHAYRGVRAQFALRALLVAFMTATVLAVPPARDRAVAAALVCAYFIWSGGVSLWTRRGGYAPVQWMLLTLLVDVVALAALTLISGASAEQTWTADLLVNGFFVIPMLAATQLRPWICLAVSAPTVTAYFAVSAATKTANTEPWSSVLLRTLALVAVGTAAVLLSRIQRSRVLMIADLAETRSALLRELLAIETRERTRLAEHLHDGALQYLLAAHQDLEDLRDRHDPVAGQRVERALRESATLLRSSVTQLHSAVLHQAGLPRALHCLASEVTERAGLRLDFTADDWADQPNASEELLYGCARELLTNVAKHAQATSVAVRLSTCRATTILVIADDGVGMTAHTRAARLAAGHIGLASVNTRVTASDGTLDIAAGDPRGTTVTITLPR